MTLELVALAIYIATIFNIILNKYKMPTIIGYILTGIIINYAFWLHEVAWDHQIKTIAEFGIVFLMFTIWLEFSVKNLIKMRKNVFLFWSMQFVLTSVIFYFLIWVFFDLSVKELIIISLWLALSSTAIILKIMTENWEINKTHWNMSLGILIFQDLMVIPILLLITLFSETNTSVWLLLWKTVSSAMLLFFILWVVGRLFINKFLLKVAHTKSNEIFIGSVLFIVIWASAIAHFFGFSYTLWAFIAGMLIAETHYKYQVEADLIPFRDLLLGFFFVTVGMQLDFSIIWSNVSIILILLVVLLLVKTLLIYAILRPFNNKANSFKTALTLFQFWEFWIVVFELAWLKNLLDPGVSQILIVVIIISMIMTPFVLKHLLAITDFVFWNKHADKHDLLLKKVYKDHVVLIWYGRLWKILSDALDEQKVDYIIVESYIKAFKEWKRDWKPIIFWNAFQKNTLKSVNIEEAKNVLISVWKSKKLFLIVSTIKKMNIDWNIIVKVNNYKEENKLQWLNIKNIIVETEKTAMSMMKKLKLK